MSTIGRAPKDYNAGAWGRVLSRIDKAIALISNRLSESDKEARQLQATQREQRATLTSMLTPEATFEWSEYVDPSTNVVYAQCIVEVTRGWAIISDFEYRSAYGNIGSTDSWLSYKTNPAMQFVVNTNYKGGGYYLYREQIDFIKSGQTFCVELRGKAANDDVWLASSHTFDGNTKPEFLSEPKLVLQWYSSTETWQVRAIGEADDDTASIGFIVSDNVGLDQQATTQYGDFVTGVTDLSGSDKRFNVLLGSFTPSTKISQRTLWVLAGAFDAASATTLDGTDNFARVLSSIEIPVSPTAAGILDAGDITGEYLADSVKRASVNLIGSHTPSSENSSITVSGTIEYVGDASPYTIASQDISVGTDGTLHYIYFDPAQDALLQSTTSKSTATSITGKRLFVGIAKGHAAERAFFVLADDQPVISAPYIYASKLQALSANMGTLQAGTAKIGDGVNGAENGIHIDEHNYWYEDGDFSVGNGSNAITYDSVTGTLTVGVATGIATYKQSAPAPSPVNAGDLWYNETDDNIQRYNGTGWDIIGSDVEYWRSVSDATKITGSVVRTGVIQSSNWPSSGTQIDLDNDTIKSGGSASPAFSVTSAGVMSCTGASVSGAITATSGSITGAFSVAAALSIGASGSLTIGGSTFATTGIQAEYNGGTPRLYAGNGADKYIKWDGSALTVAGDIYDAAGSKIFDATTKTISNSANLETLTVSGTLTIGPSGSIVAGDVADGSIFSLSGIDFVYDRVGVVGAVHKITWTNENSTESVNLGYTSTYNSGAGVYLVDDWRISSAVDLVFSAPNISLSGSAKVGTNAIWHEGNDGTGSGLDADLLDGNHASAFLTSASSISDSQLSSNIAILATTPDAATVTPDSRLKFDVGGATYYIAAEEAP